MQSFYNYESTPGIAEERHTRYSARHYEVNLLSRVKFGAKMKQGNILSEVQSYYFRDQNIRFILT